MMDFIELSNDTTRFLKEFQYLLRNAIVIVYKEESTYLKNVHFPL